MSVSLRVISIAAGASVQDAGRRGYQRYGIAESGVMDRRSYLAGAALLANAATDAVIEFSGRGGEFEVVGGPLIIACTGALMDLTVNDKRVPWNSSFRVEEGGRLVIGAARDGAYGYLHVGGGVDVAPVLGSRSTHARAGFGGQQGRCLRAGDLIAVAGGSSSVAELGLDAQQTTGKTEIRFVWGAQAHLFSVQQRQRFENSVFTMTAARDRMGARLNCNDSDGFAASSGLSGISDAVIAGDIQIGGDGMPTVLLADRQPTGGYPRIATVIAADLDHLVQLAVMSEFSFKSVSVQSAVEALMSYQHELASLPEKVAPLIRDPQTIYDLLSYNLISGVVSANTESQNLE